MANLRYLSVCSGVEAATQAWSPLGWQLAAVAEIEPFPCAVLSHRLGAGRPMFMPSPDEATTFKDRRARAAAIKAVARIPEVGRVPNFGDLNRFQEWPDATVDVLVGGSPCQSFSLAGLRKGMADPRGNLALVYLAIADRYRPRWVVWENVPGVLSSNGGRDFGTFLGGLGELGYGFAYRVLDAQYVRTRRFRGAVPQRRRRVFVVGYLGDWRRAAAVLFDGQSLRGDPPPRRESGQRPAPTLAARTRGGGGRGTDFDLDGGLISMSTGQAGAEICLDHGPTLNCNHEAPIVAHALRGEGFDASEDGTGRGTPIIPVAMPLTAGMAKSASRMPHEQGALIPIAFDCLAGGDTGLAVGDVAGALHGGGKSGGRAAVAFAENSRAELRLCGGDGQVSSQLTTGGGKPGQGLPAVALTPENIEDRHADAYEADASSALSTLRSLVGTKAYEEWGFGILAALQSPEILQSWLHGGSLRSATEEVRPELDDGALPCEEDDASKLLRALWFHGPDGRSPQGRGLATQLAGKPGAPLSILPHEGASSESGLLHLREARKGARLLREALSKMEEVGRSSGREGEPIPRPWSVRRLIPRETERLQGFTDDYTLVPVGNRQAADGPRYKAMGNSMAVNVMEWLGQRIDLVEGMP